MNACEEAQTPPDLPPIERLYRCRLDFDYDTATDNVFERVAARAERFGGSKVDVITWHGGACWNAYLVFEGSSKKDVQKVVAKTWRYIKRFKGARLL